MASADVLPLRRALVSVFDKAQLVPLCAALHGYGVVLLSTGGTAKALREAQLPVLDVSAVTQWPEMLGAREERGRCAESDHVIDR